MPVQRFLLLYGADRILLPEGETLIGRALSCRIRFNDPAVSRQHLRLEVSGGKAVAINVSSNGTLLNGGRLIEPCSLSAGDELRIGHQRILVETVDETEPGPARVRIAAQEADEDTRPEAPVTGRPAWLEAIQVHTCPQCRAQVSYFDNTCPRCDYAWPPGHPSQHTQEISIEHVRERRSPRYAIEIPVIYSSASLTIDALVRDISEGGMFIRTELLDPVGTPCEVTALPDGHSAMVFAGVVVHVADDLSAGRGSGLGIKFVGGSPEAQTWLEALLLRHESADDRERADDDS